MRSFLNSDPPKIAEIWGSQSPSRAIAQPVTTNMLEKHVFAKPYFNPDSFFLAEQNDEIVGFVHAAVALDWEQNQSEETVSAERKPTGTISGLMYANHLADESVLPKLLSQAEQYLQQQGIKELTYGGTWPAGPFYYGLYGGSRNLGVRESDQQLLNFMKSQGYQSETECFIYQRSLSGFRPAMNRDVMMVRRKYSVSPLYDPPEHSWNVNCLLAQEQRTRFELQEKATSAVVGSATFVSLDHFDQSWGVHAYGLWELQLPKSEQALVLGSYLLGESMRQLHEIDAAWLELGLHHEESLAHQLAENLEFEKSDTVIKLTKQLD